MPLAKFRLLEIFNSIIFGLTLLGVSVYDYYRMELDFHWILIIISILAFVYFYVSYKKTPKKEIKLTEGSKKFYNEFKNWYSQEGTLSIFCTDMEWLSPKEHEEAEGVLQKLEEKGDKLHLYLDICDSPIVKRLMQAGCTVYPRKKKLQTQHRLSLLDNDGTYKCIIRNKDFSSDKIILQEKNSSDDPYFISLVKDLLDDCFKKRKVLRA